jgi:PAS domain S-box-containing protein
MIADLKILIIEDNQSDADLLCRALKKSGLSFTSKIVQAREEFENALESFNPDIILSDYSLPSFDAATAFRIKQNKSPQIPFIIVSGIIGEENAVELIKIGVTDYSAKDKLFALTPKINRALKETEERKEKKIIEEKLKSQAAELIILNLELEERVASRTKALTESENRFRNMIETIPHIAWTNTVEGEITFYNQRWYDYTHLDYTQTKVGGLNMVIHPDDLQYTLDQSKSICEAGNGGEFQNRKKRADGVYRWHLIRLMPIKNEDGGVQLWVGTATDIHELRLLQQQKDDFMTIASHELKTPITSLKAALQLLGRMKDNPNKMLPILIEQANKSMERVTTLIENLLNINKLNEGQLHLNKTSFTIAQMITDCCQNIRTAGVYKIITDGDKELMLYADADRIDQVIVNFVNNAIKYAPGHKEIHVNIEKIENMAKVSVSDKGPGIPPEKLPYLFDRYYRADSSGMQYSGLGLGLYISSEIIKSHNGRIGVDSETGKGSTFWFTLPISTSH